MLSEGRAGVDDLYFLKDGMRVLRVYGDCAISIE